MTCVECGKSLFAYPCACGYQPKQLSAGSGWIIQHCSRAECSTAIRVRVGQQEPSPVCKWCEATDLHGSPYAIYDKKLYPPKYDSH